MNARGLPSDQKPDVLILCEYFVPGFRAGGPIRSVHGMVEQLGHAYDMTVITRDRDLGDDAAYPFLPDAGTQPVKHTVGSATVRYVTPRGMRPWHMSALLRRHTYDVLYVNGCFSRFFSIAPLWLRHFGLVPRRAVVVAPRGEFGDAPLRLRSKHLKRMYLALSHLVGVFSDVVWHASSEMEAAEIRAAIGNDAVIGIARDLVVPRDTPTAAREVHAPSPPRTTKNVGSLNAVFLSRISPKKNLAYALEILRDVPSAVTLDIFGPREDLEYWRTCEKIIASLPPIHTVRYCGTVEHADVKDVLSRYDVMFFPTQNENFGHVILEALAAGCPVLTSDQTSWSQIARGGAGWTIPLADRAQFSRTLEQIAQMSASTLESWRTHALQLGIQSLDDPSAAVDTDRIIRQALSTRFCDEIAS